MKSKTVRSETVASFESELRQILEDLGIQNRIIIESVD
jgi:hypothetical protein